METWSHNLSQTNMSHKLMNLMLEKENSVVKKYSENYEEENILECFGHFLSHLLDNVKKLWKSNIKKILVPFNQTFVSTFFSFPSLFDSLIHQIGIWKEMETHKTNVSCLPQTKPQWMEWMDVCIELSHGKYDLRFSLKCFSWVFWYDVLQSKSFERYPKHCGHWNTVS